MDDQKRLMLAMLLSGLIMVGYYFMYDKPMKEARAQQAIEFAAKNPQAQLPTQVDTPSVQAPVEFQDRETLLLKEQHIKIETPSLTGSFSTTGMRFDNLVLKDYHQTIKDEKNVVMFSPAGAEHAAYVFDNWTDALGDTGERQQWALVSGDVLTPETPVTLKHVSDSFTVTRKVSIDNDFLITLDDTVINTSGKNINVIRKGASRQHGLPDDLTNFFIIQEGPILIVDNKMKDMKYKGLAKKKTLVREGESGWVGLTDRYWLAAAIAPQGMQMKADFRFKNLNGMDVYEAAYELAPIELTPGTPYQSTGHIYAGAKSKTLLARYKKEQGIARMDLAIDYGVLGMLTKPMSRGLTWLGKMTGNFGVAIIVMTLLLKVVLFPLNNKSYSSMAKMKLLQPKIKKMQKRYGDDRMKLQQEMMALYRKENVSPVAGCLPMIPQMFIFFALYKSLFITFEMRHAPFFGWLKDLSAKDPLSILNGFGAFPWDGHPAMLGFLAIGPLALLYGLSMAATQTLNTPPADKMQARIFQYMPLFFMFILAGFASGLLLYWVWNNILTFIQQYIITRKYKVDTPFDRFFAKIFGRGAKSANDG